DDERFIPRWITGIQAQNRLEVAHSFLFDLRPLRFLSLQWRDRNQNRQGEQCQPSDPHEMSSELVSRIAFDRSVHSTLSAAFGPDLKDPERVSTRKSPRSGRRHKARGESRLFGTNPGDAIGKGVEPAKRPAALDKNLAWTRVIRSKHGPLVYEPPIPRRLL